MTPVPYVEVGGLRVAEPLHRFVVEEALPGTGVEADALWEGLREVVAELGPEIAAALRERTRLQGEIDAFHERRPGTPDPDEYEEMLRSIGYLVTPPDDVRVTTTDVDPEIATLAGPQLVVPLLNARFATNAANARWGSLYDALYGTDAVPEGPDGDDGAWARGRGYNKARGAEVVRRAKELLDEHVPLAGASHTDVTGYTVADGTLRAETPSGPVGLADPGQLVGHAGPAGAPTAVLLVHHGLHLEIAVDRDHPVGRDDPAGVSDVVLESAITTIMDLEDSVAAVDVDDKVLGYRNWLRLMQGTLSAPVTKDGETFERTLDPDRTYTAPDGGEVVVRGRAVLFVRQVGHLMTTDAVLDPEGREISEGVLDAVVTALGSLHDLRGPTAGANSRTGSVYVVKPKLHGPDEVALAVRLFAAVERVTGMAPGTIKVGVMDEERRTSVNLAACVAAAADRLAFVNTGFLDRTGDEIHTSMLAGPVVRKAAMKSQPWIAAYEAANVEVGLAAGLDGRGQIGKGMWAAPDEMAQMLEQKDGHPRAGASCAWVPSPTAATLHALHYHRVDVAERQRELRDGGPADRLRDLLTLPLGDPADLSSDERREEVDTNVQGILGYVVRWVDAGVGCSKVPDLDGVALMEDRATCRISSQHLANWLRHGVVTTEDVEESLRRMAAVVDEQNAGDPDYAPMAPSFDGEAFLAARELALDGARQPNGYTEPILHRRRRARKAADGP